MEKLTDRLAAIRKKARIIVDDTCSVAIDDKALLNVAQTIPNWSVQSSLNQVAACETLTNEHKIGLTLFFGVVNYGYVDPQTGLDYAYTCDGILHLRSAAFTLALIESGLPWDQPAQIALISTDIWRDKLHLNDKGVVLFDDEERINRLQQFGIYLQNTVGTFNDFFKRYPNAQSIYELLIPSGFFDDEFLKRFQIVITWLGDIAKITNTQFDDIAGTLTIMADYRLPQVLMREGVITFTHEVSVQLMSRLDDVKTERAIRAATIIACDTIAEILGITTTQVDRALWQYSQMLIANGQMTTRAMRVSTRAY